MENAATKTDNKLTNNTIESIKRHMHRDMNKDSFTHTIKGFASLF